MILQHKFVEEIPDKIPPGWIFICIKYKTAIHLCACGCGNEVVTPISPTDWQISYDGMSISLIPSIGNWNFECRSHYWITNNRVVPSTQWDDKKIDKNRKEDKKKKKKFFEFRKKKKKGG